MSGSGTNFAEKEDNFKLEEKVTAKSQSIKLMQEGFLQAYVDFFYITTETTPSEIEPSAKLQEEYKLNKRKKGRFEQTEESLLQLSDNLVSAESFYREGQIPNCLKQQRIVASQFEQLNDYETASYFYKKCLDISIEGQNTDGQAKAYMGLGICEEKVFNIFNAMGNLETALEKANSANSTKLEKEISRELVRVYQIIAIQFQDQGDFDKALQFFERCLTASKKSENKDQEAECCQKIGAIHEILGDFEKSIEMLNKFLTLCEETDNKTKAGEAHK